MNIRSLLRNSLAGFRNCNYTTASVKQFRNVYRTDILERFYISKFHYTLENSIWFEPRGISGWYMYIDRPGEGSYEKELLVTHPYF